MASKHPDTFATFDILVLNVSAATLANVRSSLRCRYPVALPTRFVRSDAIQRSVFVIFPRYLFISLREETEDGRSIIHMEDIVHRTTTGRYTRAAI